ncbi:guanyl-specific ribonuclease f1 [Pyrenophora tritici-repentis]|nr:guanyl-specific ribonuclease f1 [Pyrenophora tritici-repentis]KAI2475082.1 guanyl-specific ribonuclease f1 [Pyrenophora tritici-repentis]KAI2475524.1 guanyl-specific ribonuclease f1 [Pyrenophora tritici-repentis]KAI2475529.1 guanyl-specific ribonuclease f1 [Pyrenophora tritici-repentis]
MFNKALLTVSLLAASVLANPTPAGVLGKRDVSCGGVVYSDSQLESCRSTLCLYDDRQGPGGYPHFFSNFEGLNFGSYNGALYEYPLVGGTNGYNGGPPGADRCVVAYDSVTGNCDLLGAMTHRGKPRNAPRNAFVHCV